jgi:hypothetical protein
LPPPSCQHAHFNELIDGLCYKFLHHTAAIDLIISVCTIKRPRPQVLCFELVYICCELMVQDLIVVMKISFRLTILRKVSIDPVLMSELGWVSELLS